MPVRISNDEKGEETMKLIQRADEKKAKGWKTSFQITRQRSSKD